MPGIGGSAGVEPVAITKRRGRVFIASAATVGRGLRLFHPKGTPPPSPVERLPPAGRGIAATRAPFRARGPGPTGPPAGFPEAILGFRVGPQLEQAAVRLGGVGPARLRRLGDRLLGQLALHACRVRRALRRGLEFGEGQRYGPFGGPASGRPVARRGRSARRAGGRWFLTPHRPRVNATARPRASGSAFRAIPVARARTSRSASWSALLRPRKRTRSSSSSASERAAATAASASCFRASGSTAATVSEPRSTLLP